MRESNITEYFAYGSIMDPEERNLLGLEDVKVEPACLVGYRLAFTRQSRTWQSPAADVVPDTCCKVWGLVFKVGPGFYDALTRREGLGEAYELCSVQVKTSDGSSRAATISKVKHKQHGLPLPSEKYLGKLLSGARDGGLPPDYVSYLAALRRESEYSDGFSSHLVAHPTSKRPNARGNNLLILNPLSAKELRVGAFAVVALGDRACLAKVARRTDVATDSCEIDQSIRESLGLPGLASFGPGLRVHPLLNMDWKNRTYAQSHIMSSRSLVLSIRKSAKNDAEKNIIVLHPRNMALLGMNEGDYARVVAVVSEANGWRLRALTRRAYGGTSPIIHPDGAREETYPQVQYCYVDRDGRIDLLGEADNRDCYPVVVRPSAGNLFRQRILFYGLSLFLGIGAIDLLLDNPLISLLVALALTCGAAFVDLRGRLRY